MFLSYFSDMSHLRSSFLRSFGEWATTNPETWIYFCVAVGMTLSALVYGGLGYLVGMPLHHSSFCMYAGLTIYGIWFINHVDELKDAADVQIANIKRLRG